MKKKMNNGSIICENCVKANQLDTWGKKIRCNKWKLYIQKTKTDTKLKLVCADCGNMKEFILKV